MSSKLAIIHFKKCILHNIGLFMVFFNILYFQNEYEQLYLAANLCTNQSEEPAIYANIL